MVFIFTFYRVYLDLIYLNPLHFIGLFRLMISLDLHFIGLSGFMFSVYLHFTYDYPALSKCIFVQKKC